MFPGKFLEYMLMDKPILALISGNLADSEIKQVMDHGRFGFAYEEASRGTEFEQLKQYIRAQYDAFISTGAASHLPDPTAVDRYNWDNLIDRIIDLL